MRNTPARLATIVMGLGLLSLILSACGAGVRPTATSGAAVPAAGSQSSAAPQGGRKSYASPPPMAIDPNKAYSATIKTNMGDIKVDLNAKDAPNTVNNFVFLAREKFYDGVIFHRVIKNFMIQGGDPTGTGTGGPGYRFADEPVKGNYEVGSIAMANSGPNTNGSQFFICEGQQCTTLPPKYNLFGKVTEGIEVVHKIADIKTDTSDRPSQEVKISTIEITEK